MDAQSPATGAKPDSTPCESARAASDRARGAFEPHEIVLKYLGLVDGVVARIKYRIPSHIDAGDLHSIGVLGLMDAVKRFDPAHERTFIRFATMRIRGAILDELRRTDICSRRTRTRVRELEAAKNAVEQKLGRTATPFDMCESLGLSGEDYQKWVEEATPIRIVALDEKRGGDDGTGASLHELLADTNDETGREHLEKAELLELLTRHIAGLPEMPRKVLGMYYSENMTFSAIASAFDLTEARICQIHRGVLQGLRKWIKVAREQ